MMKTAIDESRLTETFAALSNETRRAILARLANGEATVNELAAPFDMTLPAISKHIKVLERAGLVEQGQRAQYRPCVLKTEALDAVWTWADQYRHLWATSFDRMDSYLSRLQSQGRTTRTMTEDMVQQDAVVIERTFDAPVELVWQMWTNPEHFGAWYGPDGVNIPVAKLDVRVGGNRLVCMEMQTPGGPMKMWFAGEYREIVQGRLLVYTEFISDENGSVSSMPGGYGTSGTTEVRVQFEDVGGRTKLVLTHIGIAKDSPGATGWEMALRKLDTYLGENQGR